MFFWGGWMVRFLGDDQIVLLCGQYSSLHPESSIIDSRLLSKKQLSGRSFFLDAG